MKLPCRSPFVSVLTCAVVPALLGLAPAAVAQLPNAWQIDDNSPVSDSTLAYFTNLSTAQFMAATNDGWRFTVTSRMVTDHGSAKGAMYIIFGYGTIRYGCDLDLDSSNRLVVTPLGGSPITLTADSSAATNYHTHELELDPATQNVVYRFDGAPMATLPADASTGQPREPFWGSASSADRGEMNFHKVEFAIIGEGRVAAYDAGVDGQPAVAPGPTTQGWTRSSPTVAVAEGPVSPDTLFLTPVVVTLAASEVTLSSAALNALLDPGSGATAYYFEYGTTTNYGNFTPTNTVSGSDFSRNVSRVINGLSPGTPYHFRAVAANSISTATGQDLSFSTPAVILVSSLADNGPETLRSAVAFANTNAGGAHIMFDPVLSGQTVVLTNGELLLGNSVSIDASNLPGGLVISANNNSRILEISSGAHVTLDSLTLTEGDASGSGGGILVNSGAALAINNCALSANSSAGIFNNGTLTVSNSVFSGNSGLDFGGGIENGGTATIANSTFSNNSSLRGGGIANYGKLALNNSSLSDNSAPNGSGGGLWNFGTLTVSNSTLSGNSASNGYGGGIYNAGLNAILSVNNSTLSGNSASNGYGGAIYGDPRSFLTINFSTLSNNSALHGGGIGNHEATNILNNSILFGNSAAYGGGIDNVDGAVMISWSLLSSNVAGGDGGGIGNEEGPAGDDVKGGPITIAYSTLAGNSATGQFGLGGGIYDEAGAVTITSSTLSSNSAYQGGGICDYLGDYETTNTLANCTLSGNSAESAGGGIESYSGVITILNSTFSGNSAGHGGGISSSGAVFLTNTVVAGNMAATSTNISSFFSGANNLISGDPLLAPLADYGGPTQTMPPLAGSAAIDAGMDSAASLLATDQRGYPRRSGAHVDIGAVEAQFAPTNERPLLANPAVHTDGTMTFDFANIPEVDFTVLTSTNLARPLSNWIILGPAIQSSPGQYQFTDPGATNYSRRFYRVVSP